MDNLDWKTGCFFLLVLLLAVQGCRKVEVACEQSGLAPELGQAPDGFPPIPFPEGNEFTMERWELGKRLFYDPVLSADSSLSCGSCHHVELAFADDRPFSPGIEDRPTSHVDFAPTVLMCSSLTLNGSKETFKALRMGAADFIPKDPAAVGSRDEAFRKELITKLKALSAGRRARSTQTVFRTQPQAAAAPKRPIDLTRVRAVVIGASTGGPPVLEEIGRFADRCCTVFLSEMHCRADRQVGLAAL